jgi:hypothetical protein
MFGLGKEYNYEDFIDTIMPFFEKEGFKYIRNWFSFVRKFELGSFIYDLNRLSHGMEVDIAYSIRFDEIEKKAAIATNTKLSSYDSTIYISVSNMLRGNEGSYFLTSGKEQKKAIEKTMFIYEKYAKVYFEKYSTYEQLDLLLNGDSNFNFNSIGNDKFQGNTPSMMIRGIIVSKLIGNNNKEELIERYMSQLRTRYKYDESEFIDIENMMKCI